MMALFAQAKSRTPGGFYDAQVYGMSQATHRTYAVLSAAFFIAFAATIHFRAGTIAVWMLAPWTLIAIFYLTSFLRGAHEDDE